MYRYTLSVQIISKIEKDVKINLDWWNASDSPKEKTEYFTYRENAVKDLVETLKELKQSILPSKAENVSEIIIALDLAINKAIKVLAKDPLKEICSIHEDRVHLYFEIKKIREKTITCKDTRTTGEIFIAE